MSLLRHPVYLDLYVPGQVRDAFHSNSLRMENLDTKTLKENSKASTGITIKQNGNTIETYNSKGKLIHIIDKKEVQQKIAIHRWIGTVSNEEIKEVSDGHFIEFLINNSCTKIVVDTSQLNGFFDGVNDWLASYFIPKLLKNGVKHNAFLVSQEFYSDLAMEDSDDEFPNILATRIFGAEEKALKWLKSAS